VRFVIFLVNEYWIALVTRTVCSLLLLAFGYVLKIGRELCLFFLNLLSFNCCIFNQLLFETQVFTLIFPGQFAT